MNLMDVVSDRKKAGILAIGTELTTGQILNKNASWISQKLRQNQILTSFHLTVPDDQDLILSALKFCQEKVDWIFVTGGLGPTSDDFTREMISQWTGKKLVWDESSWIKIQERLKSRGFEVKDIQKQQCYFPESSQVIVNQQGTANGFHLEVFSKDIFVLPGPPVEIESCWENYIEEWVRNETRQYKKIVTRSWDTEGVRESDVALLVNPIVNRYPHLNFEIGYRVHHPFVEVKYTYLEQDNQDYQRLYQELDQVLMPMTKIKDQFGLN